MCDCVLPLVGDYRPPISSPDTFQHTAFLIRFPRGGRMSCNLGVCSRARLGWMTPAVSVSLHTVDLNCRARFRDRLMRKSEIGSTKYETNRKSEIPMSQTLNSSGSQEE